MSDASEHSLGCTVRKLLSQLPCTSMDVTFVHCVGSTVQEKVSVLKSNGGMSCECPGRLEVSGGSAEANHLTFL